MVACFFEHQTNLILLNLFVDVPAGWNVCKRARIHQTTGGATEGAIRAREILVVHFVPPLFVALRVLLPAVASPAMGNEHHGECRLGWWGVRPWWEILSRTLAQHRLGVPVVFSINNPFFFYCFRRLMTHIAVGIEEQGKGFCSSNPRSATFCKT